MKKYVKAYRAEFRKKQALVKDIEQKRGLIAKARETQPELLMSQLDRFQNETDLQLAEDRKCHARNIILLCLRRLVCLGDRRKHSTHPMATLDWRTRFNSR